MTALSAVFDRCRRLLVADAYPFLQEGIVYHAPLNPAKRRNLALQLVNRYFLPFDELALPHTLHIGVTTACNLHCPACPTGNRSLGRPAQHLDFDTYRRTVDDLRDGLMFMLFWDWGEPLLHPRLPEMIEYAGRSGIATVTSTNGNAPGGEEKIERLVAARPSVVIACVDGIDQATYDKYRTGGKLSEACETIRRLRRAKDRLGSPYPVIEMRSLAMRANERQMPDLLQLAEDCGADLFSVKSLRPFDYRGASVDASLVPLSDKLSRYSYDGSGRRDAATRRDSNAGPRRCAKPLYAPTLNSDGTLAFCSYAVDPLERFGDLSANGALKVWRSRFARDNRLRFLRQGGTAACANCYFHGDHPSCILHSVPLRPLPADITIDSPRTREEFLLAVKVPGA